MKKKYLSGAQWEKASHICSPLHLSHDGATLKLNTSNHEDQKVMKILGMQRLGRGTISVKKYFALEARNGKTTLCAPSQEVRWGTFISLLAIATI